jgi:hypothetical protein
MDKIIYDENEDWGKRTLCSDESCIGTIGPDGKCKECGKTYEGELSEGHGVRNIQKAVVEEKKPILSGSTDSDEDWEKRILCSDESCIGTIGTDGRCRECGKPGKQQ